MRTVDNLGMGSLLLSTQTSSILGIALQRFALLIAEAQLVRIIIGPKHSEIIQIGCKRTAGRARSIVEMEFYALIRILLISISPVL